MKRYSGIAFILLLTLAACGGSPAAPQPQSAAPLQGNGVAAFRDRLATADQFVLQMTGVSAPPAGQAYQGWLTTDDGNTTSIGVLPRGADGAIKVEWNSPNSENLLARYSKFQVSLEPATGNAKPSGKAVFAGEFNAKSLADARNLFVRAGSGSPAAGPTARPTRCDDPYGCGPSAMSTDTPYAVGLKAQTDLAVQHAQNASNAAAIGSLAELRVHLEHLINILEGANGARFGDYDGDGQKQNPGDGYGVVLYLTRMGDHASNAESARALIDGARKQITAIEDKAVEISKAPNAASAANSLKDLKAMADKLKNEPVAQIYQMAQDSLKFPVTVKP